MTALRQSAIAELERVPEDKLAAIIQFINNLMKENETKERGSGAFYYAAYRKRAECRCLCKGA